MMKKILLMCCFLAGISMAGHAQNRMRMSPEERAKTMQTNLKLSDEQTVKITALLQTQATKRDSIRNAGGNRQDMRPLMQTTNDKIMEVLTDEQKEAYRKMMEEMRARRQNRDDSSPSN